MELAEPTSCKQRDIPSIEYVFAKQCDIRSYDKRISEKNSIIMRFYIMSFYIMQNYIISGQIQECPIILKQTMAATISLCEFYGGQFFRKMIHSLLNLINSPSARLASAMQIVTELCLTDTCKFFQTSKREYPGIFQIHFTVNRHCRNFMAG